MSNVKSFYDDLQFPGHYTLSGLDYHSPKIKNPYLKIINAQLDNNISVLDVGCGTGLITNLFARKYPTSNFTGIDFADSINYAAKFATVNNITNVEFERHDFTKYPVKQQFDVVVCQGVLHHIPNRKIAIEKLKQLVKPNGTLVLGLYHPWGKIAKKFIDIDYHSEILYQDQENHPFEDAYNFKQVVEEFSNFTFQTAYPYFLNTFIAIPSFFNYRNGGLVTYVLKKNHETIL